MVPVINAFKTAHHLTDVTFVADAGMISEANQVALQASELPYILGARIPYLPDVLREWRAKHADEPTPDGVVLTQPWPATSSEKSRGIPDRVVHYQFRHDRARRTLLQGRRSGFPASAASHRECRNERRALSRRGVPGDNR